MADFVQSTESKNAVRRLAAPISDVTAFETIVQSVIATNPFGCMAYMSAGIPRPGVEKTRERYSVHYTYETEDAKNHGTGMHIFTSVDGYTAGVNALGSAGPVTSAHGGTPVHMEEDDTYSATVKCRDPNGETYNVVFNRDRVLVESYSDDAVLAKVENWADTVAALA